MTQATDPVNPDYYKLSGVETIQVAENLTFNAGNAVKYLVRSSRIDGVHKGNRVEDLRKARWLVDREIERLGG